MSAPVSAPADVRPAVRRRVASRPDWTRTIRFRLALAYSTLLSGLAALVVGAIYLGVARQVSGAPLARTFTASRAFVTRDGRLVLLNEGEVAKVGDLEAVVNARALETLQRYSLGSLLALFVASLAIGWWLSGRALRPVRSITSAAREITASDLSRRIRLRGPDDELRRLADTIDAMLERLDESFTAQRQLVDDASHELRNPLAVIQTNVDAVLRHDDVSPAERERAAAVVSRATARMAGLVEDLLATARRAAPAFVEADVDLAGLARDAVEEAALPARERGVLVRAQSSPGSATTVIADREALRRAVGNLLDNALRYSPPGGEVVVSTGQRGQEAYVAVRDAGPGIEPAVQRRVFDRFYRAEGNSAGGHAGLGLAIVRQIAESHGGRVELVSAPGAGSTFVLWLPLRTGGGAAGGQDSARSRSSASARSAG